MKLLSIHSMITHNARDENPRHIRTTFIPSLACSRINLPLSPHRGFLKTLFRIPRFSSPSFTYVCFRGWLQSRVHCDRSQERPLEDRRSRNAAKSGCTRVSAASSRRIHHDNFGQSRMMPRSGNSESCSLFLHIYIYAYIYTLQRIRARGKR